MLPLACCPVFVQKTLANVLFAETWGLRWTPLQVTEGAGVLQVSCQVLAQPDRRSEVHLQLVLAVRCRFCLLTSTSFCLPLQRGAGGLRYPLLLPSQEH